MGIHNGSVLWLLVLFIYFSSLYNGSKCAQPLGCFSVVYLLYSVAIAVSVKELAIFYFIFKVNIFFALTWFNRVVFLNCISIILVNRSIVMKPRTLKHFSAVIDTQYWIGKPTSTEVIFANQFFFYILCFRSMIAVPVGLKSCCNGQLYVM